MLAIRLLQDNLSLHSVLEGLKACRCMGLRYDVGHIKMRPSDLETYTRLMMAVGPAGRKFAGLVQPLTTPTRSLSHWTASNFHVGLSP